ncbi:MAG: hypothetical protein PHI55_01475 [Burkholderiaceae bacterium]|nr:hypothetical protein [Burkholderiaceae bacterium]
MLAAVSQEHTSGGIETIWQICANLQKMGYPVVVLDGSAPETPHTPGLQHLLQQAPWRDEGGLDLGVIASSLAVIPAFHGLQQLAQLAQTAPQPPLERLLPYFRAYGLLVLHASADLLGELLTHTHTAPLVVMDSNPAGVLKSYQSCKQIALTAGLSCLVAARIDGQGAGPLHRAQVALETLEQCADRHLGGHIKTTTIQASQAQDLQRLALQFLENAGSIGASMTSTPWASTMGHSVRSH